MTASTGNQDVINILTADHHEVLALLEQIPMADAGQRRDMADTVIAELMRHSVAEEMYVYPAMRDHLPDGAGKVEHDIEEHQQLEEAMKELEGIEPADVRFLEVLARLERVLRDHVSDEEDKHFPELRALWRTEHEIGRLVYLYADGRFAMSGSGLQQGSLTAPAGRAARPSARDRLLAAAAECFYDHGVTGTGIDTITAAAGVAKMSLYNNFASKDDLVLAYLEARHEEWLGLYRRRLAQATDAGGRVAAVFDAYVDHAEMAYRHGFRGCGLLNAAAELPAGAPGRALVRRHKEQVEALLAAHLAELDGLPAERVADLAEQLSFLLEGAMARAGLEGDSRRLHRVRDLALQLVDAAADRTVR